MNDIICTKNFVHRIVVTIIVVGGVKNRPRWKAFAWKSDHWKMKKPPNVGLRRPNWPMMLSQNRGRAI